MEENGREWEEVVLKQGALFLHGELQGAFTGAAPMRTSSVDILLATLLLLSTYC